MAEAGPIKIKVDIISGFLGAGKTTFIQKLIDKKVYADNKLVILENEFGKVNIDGQILSALNITIENIVAECICCTGADSLLNKLITISQDEAPDYLIIEPTGVAHLSDIRRVFQYKTIKELYQINNIITVIDAKNYRNWIKVANNLFEDQIRFSNVILINKSETCPREEIMELAMLLDTIHPDCPIFLNESCLLDSMKTNLPLGEKKSSDRALYFASHTNENFDSYSFEYSGSIKKYEFEQFIGQIQIGRFGDIYRIKGYIQDEFQKKYSVEYVNHDFRMIQMVKTLNQVQPIEICFIGRNIDNVSLNEYLTQLQTN